MEGFDGDGFVSLSIVYSVSCAVDLLAPSVVALAGMKATLVLASCAYPAFIATFYVLQDWLLYSGSAVVGVGNALYWVGQARKMMKTISYRPGIAAAVFIIFIVVAAAVAVVAVAVGVAVDIVVDSAAFFVVVAAAAVFLFEQCHTCTRNT